MQKLLFKKHKGEENFISGLIVTFTLMATLFICIMMIQNVSRNNDIKSVCRGYLYTMETKGYLTEANKDSLKLDLEALGVKNIDFTGTTLSPAEYGTVITLQVKFDTPIFTFNANSSRGAWAYSNVTVVRKTVAKH